ncbi:hypothetical protein M409DRAFT_67247 [Zasmidium cellare ATCC 36951]|uniref:NAD(P)-binding protein n=1 Tax=Zasmidium cellare ATCC 36951 TaxID=1080233 RepID=A0A6A6CJ20_ZASCE|nr:uncharacterized protein M409DRAFT_67247 [Zasmidium cellare ATCC 36951]KAF2165416.1 hypothetical protein M409DRAFT_67247 [Zasmidium cellare ATCC 36951]
MPSWLVTGASRGLGYAWITHLAAQTSNTVFAIVRNVKATEDRLAKDNVKNITVLSADIVDYAALEKAAAEVAKVTGGGLDYLIHNAALVSAESAFSTLLDGTPEGVDADLTESFNANVLGTAHVVRAFLPLIRKGQAKKVVVISSGMADIDLINRFNVAIAGPYAISKAAANALVSKYHAAVGKSEGILIFSMSPGFVDTKEGKPPSQEEIEGGKAMAAQFAEYAPHFKGPITPEESVKYQLQVIDKATVDTYGGSFVSHFGNKQWL